MSSDQFLRGREAAEEQDRRDAERFKFVNDIETHLSEIIADAGKARLALQKWATNAQRHTIDGEGIEVSLCDISNSLDNICTELSGP